MELGKGNGKTIDLKDALERVTDIPDKIRFLSYESKEAPWPSKT